MKQGIVKVSVILLLCVLLLNGCNAISSNGNSESSESAEINHKNSMNQVEENVMGQQEEKQKADSDSEDGAANSSADQQLTQVQPPVSIDVPIYTLNNETLETKATVASVSEDTPITAELIVELVVSDIADKSYVINVNEVSTEEDKAVVDFSSKTPPVVQASKEVEGTILDAIAFSIIDNVPECNGVIFRVDGKAYTSENMTLGFDQVYNSR